MRELLRRGSGLQALALALVVGIAAPVSWAQDVKPVAAAAAAPAARLGADLWQSARSGDAEAFDRLVRTLAQAPDQALGAASAQFVTHVGERETARQARITEVLAELEKHLAADKGDISLAKALRSAIEWHMLSTDKDAVLADPRVQDLITRCASGAREAEARGDSLTAGELFVLLDALLDVQGTYKSDVRRIAARQEMLRLYVPERMYELRNQRAMKEDDAKPLPPYNPFGDSWQIKLGAIDQTMVERCLQFARKHITQRSTRDLLKGGLDNVRTMVTTTDLAGAFPGLADDQARTSFLAFLDAEEARLAEREGDLDAVQIGALVDRLRRKNDQTTRVASTALLHEFGNGAMSTLDEFSEMIWPDEVRRFNKNTQGRFVGVGIQIEHDELQNIRVVTPIEGTPAQRAGVHAGDIIAKVDGRTIFGLTLDQAVDVITGPQNTNVTLTIERAPADAGPDAPKESIDFTLKRSVIKIATVKGWKREGAKETDWNWFIDQPSGIGYVRLTQFADSTGAELDRAIAAMKASELHGLILDLRFNPGGLLEQAVHVSQRFIDAPEGFIVVSKGASGRLEDPHFTDPEAATLAKIPVVVLVNEGSASASEIVSGAISRFAAQGSVDAVVLGARSFGKGSVQNVWPVTATSMIKVTTAYYMLPDKSIIHRRPGDKVWGVEPNLKIEMLPKQTSDAILARRDADIVALNENGIAADTKPKVEPESLISKGTDLQLEAALLLLRGKVTGDGTLARSDR